MPNEKSYQTSVVSKFLYFQGISTTLGVVPLFQAFSVKKGHFWGVPGVTPRQPATPRIRWNFPIGMVLAS